MLNIAPFGYETATGDPAAAELRWDEPRDLSRVVLRFAGSGRLPAPDEVRLLYWRRVWPQSRWEERGTGSGSSSWATLDGWYNGEWQQADVAAAVSGDSISFSFRPLANTEFPNLPD